MTKFKAEDWITSIDPKNELYGRIFKIKYITPYETTYIIIEKDIRNREFIWVIEQVDAAMQLVENYMKKKKLAGLRK